MPLPLNYTTCGPSTRAIRTKAIPALVILLSLAAIGVTTVLQARADAGRDAQLKLENLESELTRLQNAPFKASARTGGSPAAALVRWSHERFDGTGYPDALRGDAIPLGASIIAVCDAFDAMMSERPYRSAMPIAAALDELRQCAGTQFDPRVVDAFRALAAERESAPLAA